MDKPIPECTAINCVVEKKKENDQMCQSVKRHLFKCERNRYKIDYFRQFLSWLSWLKDHSYEFTAHEHHKAIIMS